MKITIKACPAIFLTAFSTLAVADGYISDAVIGSISLANAAMSGGTTPSAQVYVTGQSVPGCYGSAQGTPILLPDLTDLFQREAYATLLTAKINGMPIKQLNYSTANYLCIITNVWLGS